MTDREFKRLSRPQLIEIIYQLQLREEELSAENQKLKDQLEDKRIRLEQAGNIAEAVLGIHDVMQTAQDAAQLYVDEIRAMRDETRVQCDDQLQQTRVQCDDQLQQTRAQCDDQLEQTRVQCHDQLQQTRAQCDDQLQQTRAQCDDQLRMTREECDKQLQQARDEGAAIISRAVKLLGIDASVLDQFLRESKEETGDQT